MGTRGFVGYKKGDEIKGWYNQFDSYPDYLGQNIIEVTFTMNQEQIKDFFLNRLTLVEDDPDNTLYGNHKTMYDQPWNKGKYTLQDGENFYKDALFCEYSYIFDLDAKEKTLLLFKGFGKKPSKGYENWVYKSHGDTFYVIPCGKLTYKNTIEETFNNMVLKVYKDDPAAKLYRKIKRVPKKDLPLLLGEFNEDLVAEARDVLIDLAKSLIESRLKEKPQRKIRTDLQ